MANRVPTGVTADIAALFEVGAMGNWPDSDFIAQFVTGEEAKEAAFRILIHRYGPMVLGVCRRVLSDEHAAEDAFQSTFMVFVKKAGGLRDGNRLTNWLYGVALRVAKKERTKAARRRRLKWGSTIYRAASEPPRSDAKLADTQPTVAPLPARIAKRNTPQPAQTPRQIAPSPATGSRTMKFHLDGDVITYEWSIQPFDRFPDRPAHIVPGHRLGLDVAVVDKDRDGLTKISPPTYLSWASSPVRFKGIDPESLGNLLIDRPPDR